MFRVFPFLAAAFLAIPLVEIALFIIVGGRIGALATILIVIATGITGATVVSYQGLAVVQTLQKDLAEGRLPVMAVVEGFLLLAAALLLITPGFATDAIGFSLALPPVRRWIAAQLRGSGRIRAVFNSEAAEGRAHWHGGTGARDGYGPIIEGEILDTDRTGRDAPDRK